MSTYMLYFLSTLHTFEIKPANFLREGPTAFIIYKHGMGTNCAHAMFIYNENCYESDILCTLQLEINLIELASELLVCFSKVCYSLASMEHRCMISVTYI